MGVDEEKGPQVLNVDPAGHYLPFKGTASGSKEEEATNYLEKRVGSIPEYTFDGTVRTAILLGKCVGE